MQLLSSVVLFVKDQQASYNLFLEPDTLRYLFSPTTLTAAWYLLPSFWLYKTGAEWKLKGVDDEELKMQAIDKVCSLDSVTSE
jgi:hypothetical protein